MGQAVPLFCFNPQKQNFKPCPSDIFWRKQVPINPCRMMSLWSCLDSWCGFREGLIYERQSANSVVLQHN